MKLPENITRPVLDRSKPHGIVTPPENGANFAQDGLHFDQDGNLVEDMLTEADVARLQRKSVEAEANKAAETARRAFLADQGLDPDDPDLSTKLVAVAIEQKKAADDPSSVAGDVDLVAWATKTATYPWYKVAAAARAKHNFVATDARALVAFMIEEKLVAEDQVKVATAAARG